MKKHVAETLALAAAALLALGQAALAQQADPGRTLKQVGKGPVTVFILAGQSNMDGQASVSTIDFLGEDKEHGYLLKKFKPDGKTLVTRDDVWVAHRGVYGKLGPARATSDKGYHYFGEGRFFILVGKSFAETMLELMGVGK